MRAPKLAVLLLATAAGLVWAAPGVAQSLQVVSVNTTGCASGNFGMTIERAGLDGSANAYTIHTVVTVGEFVYMNEGVGTTANGQIAWSLFDNINYGTVPNKGTWPIPQNNQMRIDFTLERPKGNILYAWTTVVKSCNAGGIQYNGTTATLPFRPRTLGLNYERSTGRFIGWLYAKGAPKLHSRRIVTIWKVRPGPDLKVGRVRTSTRGNFALRRARIRGTYYAVAGAIILPPVGHAFKERSTNLVLR
jgi:hypothetical protein